MKAEKLIVAKKLPTYQVDKKGALRPVMLMNEFQAMADAHANILGVGRDYCAEHNIGWVVTHYTVDIKELPGEGEEIKIITWPAKHEGVKAIREFEIRGANGDLMVAASSQWIVINLETRRPMRLADAMGEWEYIPMRALDAAFDKFDEFDSPDSVDFRVRYDDMDVNMHVNNAVYATWATESLGADFLDGHKLKGLRINFKKEIPTTTKKVSVFYAKEGNMTKHAIKSDAATHAIIECDWE
jgi:medium-chain acyl-[acyl-carrier-protein] hydrolase